MSKPAPAVGTTIVILYTAFTRPPLSQYTQLAFLQRVVTILKS